MSKQFPGFDKTEIYNLRDAEVLHTALFEACKELVGVDPTWNPHLKFRELYFKAVEINYKVQNNPCSMGLFLDESVIENINKAMESE